MSGAAIVSLALGGQSGGGSGGSDVTPNPISFSNVQGSISGATNSQTISGINAPITLEIDYSGAARIECLVNGSAQAAAGSGTQVVISNGQTLQIVMQNFTNSIESGAVTVKNISDSGAVLATFNYSLSGQNDFI